MALLKKNLIQVKHEDDRFPHKLFVEPELQAPCVRLFIRHNIYSMWTCMETSVEPGGTQT